MSMQCAKRLRRALQPNLFDPVGLVPEWRQLPADTREKTVRLLAQMLREHRRTDRRHRRPAEAGDE
jgi:hypothetical protein